MLCYAIIQSAAASIYLSAIVAVAVNSTVKMTQLYANLEWLNKWAQKFAVMHCWHIDVQYRTVLYCAVCFHVRDAYEYSWYIVKQLGNKAQNRTVRSWLLLTARTLTRTVNWTFCRLSSHWNLHFIESATLGTVPNIQSLKFSSTIQSTTVS